MHKFLTLVLVLMVSLLALPASAQFTRVVSDKRNIEIRVSEKVNVPAEIATVTKFSAAQEWRIHVKASEAQKAVDTAVAAGANQVSEVSWSVADPRALEAKAYAAALNRAKAIAESTASQAGVKLGEILSIANSASDIGFFTYLNTEAASLSVKSEPSVRTTPLTLFPPGIEREASVTVIFAIEK